jgi:glycerol uptake facilitator-like aquaporin
MNPATTLTFLRLGKVGPWDALFYILAQFLGAIASLSIFSLVAGDFLSHPAVNYVATLPGAGGVGIAFLAESLISFILMVICNDIFSRNVYFFRRKTRSPAAQSALHRQCESGRLRR